MFLGTMASGFSVEARRLSGLAAELEEAGAELRQAVSQFAAVASPEPGLFGLLGPGPAAVACYREVAHQALEGLRAAATALDADVASGLRATAARYLASEGASVLR